MCGIAGALDLRDGHREFPIDRALAMTRAIVHRGPDAEGIHREPGVFLGARRLSIVDLAGGFQPIPNEDGTVWVAFNGELFDDHLLRVEMLEKGHRLASRCDTELWVHLFEEYGPTPRLLEKARGQFAVSLWDRKSRTLLLARDRVGICPLFYAQADGWLIWASEIKSLLASGMVRPQADRKGLDFFFHTFSASVSRTCFEGISLLPPGHFLTVKDGRIFEREYWDLDFPAAGEERGAQGGNVTPLVDEFEDLIRSAVRKRLRGDVPVVSYISGGLDSTVVLGVSSQERGTPLPSFTIALNNAGPAEGGKAAESAAVLGSKLTRVEMTKRSIVDAYPELIRAAEMPVMDTACATLLRLAQAVHEQGYKVALTGEGADEALAGYFWFKTQKVRDRLKARFGDNGAKRMRTWFLNNISKDLRARPDRFPIRGTRIAQQDVWDMLAQSRSRVYSSSMWEAVADYDAFGPDLGISNPRYGEWAPLNQSLYVGYKGMLAGLLLAGKGDRVAMNASVETRYPLLDEDVVHFCSQISPDYKLHGMTDKWMLRQVAKRRLPAKIANRPKTMFQASLSRAFVGDHRPGWVDQLLSEESLARAGYFDPAMVTKEIARRRWMPRITPRQGGMDLGLAMVAATQLWHHIYLGGDLCELPAWTAPRLAEIDVDVPDAADVHAEAGWMPQPVA